MFFSIVIPTYNREKTITRAINSILQQTYTDYEIVVVDDGSIDKTASVIESYNDPRIKYFKTENFGVAHARNYGIKQAKAQYLGFLDSDDMMEMNHLQSAYDFILIRESPEVVHLNFLWGDEDKVVTHKNQLPKHLPEDIFKNCSLHVNCIFIKNEVVKQNLFNESRELMFAEDWDFFIKLAVRFPIHLSDKTTAYLVDHDDRSMRNFDEKKWVLKRDAIVLSLASDRIISEKFSNKPKVVCAHMNSLIAINFAVNRRKINTIRYWLLSIRQNISELFTRRSLAIIKHLFFSW